jgi:serine/threonine protein kinase
MKIVRLDPNGLIQAELSGIRSLEQSLSEDWFGFSNLMMRSAGRNASAEIDVVFVTHDRLFLVDLKNWYGKITVHNGTWFQNGQQRGKSAAVKTAMNARKLQTLLEDSARLSKIPWVEGYVVFTNPECDISDLDKNDSAGNILRLDDFIRFIRNHNRYDQAFQSDSYWKRDNPLTARDPKRALQSFFGSNELFSAADAIFDNYKPIGAPTFEHPSKLYQEYNCDNIDDTNFTALLRYWDFGLLPAEAHVSDERKRIASREMSVQGYIKNTDPELYESTIMHSRSRDNEYQMRYWELFELGRSMRRINEYLIKRNPDYATRRDIASMLISSLSQIHRSEVAHRDLGAHSVWYDEPRSRIVISAFGAAYYPERRTIGDYRQTLSAGVAKLPEDLPNLGIAPGTPYQQDVFLLTCLTWTILTGQAPPQTQDGLADWTNASFDRAHGLPEALRGWFASGLAWEPPNRFKSAVEMHTAFLTATSPSETKRQNKSDFGLYERATPPFITYPVSQPIQSEDSVMWISEAGEYKTVVKFWPGKLSASGVSAIEVQRFLETAGHVKHTRPVCLPEIIDAGISRSDLFLAYKHVEGKTLDTALIDDVDKAYLLCGALLNCLVELHSYGPHGDLSPQNILVSEEPGNRPSLLFLDFPALVALSDQRITPAYAPLTPCEPLTRDRFAAAKLISEMLRNCGVVASERSDAGRLLLAAERCLSEDDGGLTLRPLLSAIEQNEIASRTASVVMLVRDPSFDADQRLVLSNDHRYNVVVDESTQRVIIVGFDEQVEVRYDPSSAKPLAAKLRPAINAEAWAEKNKVFTFNGELHLARSDAFEPACVDWLWMQPAVTEKLKVLDASRDMHGLPVQRFVSATQLTGDLNSTKSQPPSSMPNAAVDVEDLWRATLDVEDEALPEAIVTGPAVWDPTTRLTLVPCEYTKPDAEFDRLQPLALLHDRRKIGEVAVERMSSTELPIKGQPRGQFYPGMKLALQSPSEFDNISRRRRAVARIIDKESVIPDLLNYFKPSCSSSLHQHSSVEVRDSEIERYGLNQSQGDALRQLWRYGPLGLLQGPPGTGKTTFIASFVHFALSRGGMNNVLLLSQSHEAVNNAAERLLKMFDVDNTPVSLLRVGQGSKVSDTLIPFHSESAQDHYRQLFISEQKNRIAIVGRELGISQPYLDELFETLEHLRMILSIVCASSDELEDAIPLEAVDAARSSLASLLLDMGVDQALPFDQLSKAITVSLARKHSESNPDALRRLSRIYNLSHEWTNALAGQRSLEQFLARSRNIVSGTCVGVGKRSLGIDNTKFDLVIIDEAAKCGPSELAIGMQVGRRILLVGDHKQLPPFAERKHLRLLAQRFPDNAAELTQTDFERAFTSSYGRSIGVTLSTQYRMVPSISALVSACFYPDVPLETGRGPSPSYYQLLPAPLDDEITWIDTSAGGSDAYESREGPSRSNKSEAHAIIRLLRILGEAEKFWEVYDLSYRPEEKPIGVISMYGAQKDLLNRLLVTSGLTSRLLARVKVDTVDSYQGQENAIVIVSLVRNNAQGEAGHIDDLRRVNVALSRAMERLVVVGSADFVSRQESDNPLRQVLTYMRRLPTLSARIMPAAKIRVDLKSEQIAAI